MTKKMRRTAQLSAGSNPRKLAFECLLRFEKSGATRLKADRLITETLARQTDSPLSSSDRGFLHALVMGVLRHWFRLDSWIIELTGCKLKDIQPAVRVLLRMGFFQLYGLSHVPAYAAIDTTVALAKAQRQNIKAIKFINAVLRECQRRLNNGGFTLPDFESQPIQHLQCCYGWPPAFSEYLLRKYKSADVLAMAQAMQNPAPLTIRVNTLKISPERYLQELTSHGITAQTINPALPEAFLIPDFSGSPQQLVGYKEGWFYVQDPASMQVTIELSPQPDETILDLCAAPGSKTTHIAAHMGNQGAIDAIESKEKRLALLQENLQRLGVTNVRAILNDGLQFEPTETLYDRVLVDAPCSGSGTLRRHPEILLYLKKLDTREFKSLQFALLKKGFACLKPGGTLIYSTCSILPTENREVIQAFLKEKPEAILVREQQDLITSISDGFYHAQLQKKP